MISFFKMHGLGNDYIFLDYIDKKINIKNIKQFVKNVCNRNFGVGADGLIILTNHSSCDAKMIIYNSDGSKATMCGNATRCAVFYLSTKLKKTNVKIKCSKRVLFSTVKALSKNKAVVEVELTKPKLQKIQRLQNPNTNLYIVSTGNNHAVLFDQQQKLNIQTFGKDINNIFDDGINVELVKIINKHTIKMQVYERGAGVTLACGSGAIACAYLSNKLNLTNNIITVKLDGGELKIKILKNKIIMIGDCQYVYSGEINDKIK